MSSEPVKRTLSVLEYFASQGPKPVSLMEIARACDIAPATLSRIVGTLEESGYIQRMNRKEYVANFQLKKLLPMSEGYLAKLEEVLHEIAQRSEQSAEAIVLDNNQLLWHSKIEYEDMAIRLRAHPGFRRNLYELDAPSRLFLKSMGWAKVKSYFEMDAFFSTGLQRRFLAAQDVEELIEKTSLESVEYDLEGNIRGVRRFAKAVKDSEGRVMHLLCIAEAALAKTDMQAHVDNNVKVLNDAALVLQGHCE